MFKFDWNKSNMIKKEAFIVFYQVWRRYLSYQMIRIETSVKTQTLREWHREKLPSFSEWPGDDRLLVIIFWRKKLERIFFQVQKRRNLQITILHPTWFALIAHHHTAGVLLANTLISFRILLIGFVPFSVIFLFRLILLSPLWMTFAQPWSARHASLSFKKILFFKKSNLVLYEIKKNQFLFVVFNEKLAFVLVFHHPNVCKWITFFLHQPKQRPTTLVWFS